MDIRPYINVQNIAKNVISQLCCLITPDSTEKSIVSVASQLLADNDVLGGKKDLFIDSHGKSNETPHRRAHFSHYASVLQRGIYNEPF